MIDEILNKMTLEDKIALCSGKNFWQTEDFEKYGIPSMFMCDGPHGLRKQEGESDILGINDSRKSTCFPAEVTTAGSWDISLLYEIGQAIAEEARNQKVGLVLGPGVNIKRNPLCGRNFEYFSEDPYLAGKLAAAFIRGAENKGVGTSLKHYAGNSQERDRFISDSVIDERTLREIYLSAFETAVKEGKPSTVMCAYPKLNGVHCSENRELLTDILRTEWGFDGTVVTDWGAMGDRIEGFRAGCDLNMPGGASYMEKETAEAVLNGQLEEDYVNQSARRILELVFKGTEAMTGEECDYDAHNELCRRAAASGAVLLKNENGLLPLRDSAKVAVIGSMAVNMRYQGSGSSHINPYTLCKPIDSIPGCVYAQGCNEDGSTDDKLLSEVSDTAAKSDVAVVFAGLPASYESEGFDREDMMLPRGHIDMINAAASANRNTVVVLMCGSPVECDFEDKVRSILFAGLPGQAGGQAIADVLYGRIVPSGKLAESWPFRYSDVTSSEYYAKERDALYLEGLYEGYRYYDKACVPVRYPFGYGLSYTHFSYSSLKLDGDMVSVTITNDGHYDGAEVVQMYIRAPQSGIHRPVWELKRFEKIFLKTGESREVTFTLDDRCFSVWQNGWKVPSGTYEVCIDELSISVDKEGDAVVIPSYQEGSFYEECQGRPDASEFEAMLGRKIVKRETVSKGSYTMENTVDEMRRDSLVMKIMYKAVEKMFLKQYGKEGRDNPEFKMMMASSVGSAFRSMYISSGVKGGVFPGLLEIANGHFLKGIGKMISGK